MSGQTQESRKTVSIMIPCYNEEENVVQITQAVIEQMQALPQYDYEVLLIDNCSTDHTRELIRQICSGNPNVKAILNAKNFGQFNSPYYGLCQTTGDCAISICADFQDPVEMIPEMLRYWEEGYQIVCGVKTSSQESKIMYRLRGLYYKAIKRYSEVEQIEQFTGFGLYDRRFLEVMRSLDDSKPFLRGIVAELGGKRKEIPYDQPLRRAGKTHNNLRTLFDAFMLSVTIYTKQVGRMVEVASVALVGGAIVYGAYQLIRKKLFWDEYNAGIAPIIAIIMILSAVFFFLLAILGEYVSTMNQRIMHRPLVVEEERINFGSQTPKPMGVCAALVNVEKAEEARKRISVARSLLASGSELEIVEAVTELSHEEVLGIRELMTRES